ncbi:MAG TPA: glycosyltransferase N-terminal domain-containing protein [Bacteroidia bacterium]|jgi:3-deoxy-D-manno-octulosonic-acid transferase|nr:glycosyltransferase N-terminal domain-containing protein [Bacteroidia bacterium]
MMRLLYTLFIYLYVAFIRFASLFNAKAKLWIAGRKDIFRQLKSKIQSSPSPVIWIHCASLGEFEQGRPIIEKLKKDHEDIKIVLTFFSPSGYEVRKNYTVADHVFYLPLDTPANAKKFIATVRPTAAFFVKYEFWFNYLTVLKNNAIPTYLVSGIFRPDHYFFKGYASWFRSQLTAFNHFYLQDEQSQKLLNSIGFKNTTVAGDTRFDRVAEVAMNAKNIPVIELFKEQRPLFIAGSTWEQDEELLADFDFAKAGFKLIVAPHEITEARIQFLLNKFKNKVQRYSKITEADLKATDVLIIDNMGMLSSIYQYGTVAFIGGGFGKGIHNILEPAAFGLPVLFGPNYKKFEEAKELTHLRGAFVVNNSKDLQSILQLLTHSPAGLLAEATAKRFIQHHLGATNTILGDIKF